MSRNQKRLLWVTIIILTIAMTGIVSAARRTYLNRKPIQPVAPSSTQPANLQLSQDTRQIVQMESELITVTPHGFEPREITRPKGSFLLMIDNRSGLRSVAPQLKLLGGLKLLDLNIPREEPNWSDVLDLQPGVYLLTEAGHPAWLCRVTITP